MVRAVGVAGGIITMEEEDERPSWMKAGWLHPPRNGQERKTLRDGGHPPGMAPKKCHKFVKETRKVCGGENFEPYTNGDGKTYFRCMTCRNRYLKAYRTRHPDRVKKCQKAYYRRIKTLSVEKGNEGVTTISMTWFKNHLGEAHKRVVDGETFVVEQFGAPSFVLTPVSEYLKGDRHAASR